MNNENSNRQQKRAVWHRIKSDMPEFVPTLTELAQAFGVDKIAVDRHDGKWMKWEKG